jgi:hypothetical protein
MGAGGEVECYGTEIVYTCQKNKDKVIPVMKRRISSQTAVIIPVIIWNEICLSA